MGYYCTVPQCTSLAGKTKNVKFHRFPRDVTMADKWNDILKRGKPYTKYSKVCSLHFTQADYNVTTMGQWKTLNKDAVPSQNLPRLHPDGTVMVIRKSRSIKCREARPQSCHADKLDKYSVGHHASQPHADPLTSNNNDHDNVAYRLHALSAIASNLSPQPANPSHQHVGHNAPNGPKPKKQDAFMQTDPIQSEDDDSQPDNSYNEPADPYTYSDPYKDDKPYTPYKSHEKEYHVPIVQYKDKDYDMQTDPYKGQDNSYKNEDNSYKSQDNSYKNEDNSYKSQDNSYKGQDNSYKHEDSSYKHQDVPYKNPEHPYKVQENSLSPSGSYKNQENKDYNDMSQKYNNESPKNYTKQEDYIPQTNEEYNKEAEKYALERKNLSSNYEKPLTSYDKPVTSYDKPVTSYEKPVTSYDKQITSYDKPITSYVKQVTGYEKPVDSYSKQVLDVYQKVPVESYQKMPDMYADYQARSDYLYNNSVYEEARRAEFAPIKQELDLDDLEASSLYGERARGLLPHQQVKREPDINGCEAMPGYYHNGHSNLTGGYGGARPGAELLIAKQNALAAHTQLWQNTMKRPFFYTENYPTAPLLRYHEDYTKILQ